MDKLGIKKKIGNKSLKTRIIMITVLVSFIPAVLITMSSYRIMTSDLYEQKAQNTFTNLSSINQSVNSAVNLRRISALRTIRTSQTAGLLTGKLDGAEKKEAEYSLERFFNEYQNTKGIQSVSLYGSSGECWDSGVNPLEHGRMREKFEVLKTTQSPENYWDHPELINGVWTIRFNMPVTSPNAGELTGLLSINFLEDELESTYSYYETETDHILILSKDGTVMSSKDKNSISSNLIELSCIAEENRDNTGHGSSKISYNGEDILFSYIVNEPNGFYIIDLGSLQTIKDARTKLASSFLLAVGFSLVIVLILASFLSNNLTRPVQKLVSAISSMNIENIRTDVGFHYNDEIGVIGNALDEMSEKLRDSSRKLLEEQKSKQEAELQMLMQQINPHFLYNTLSTVIWMIQCNQKQESIEVIKALSTLFKLGVNRGREETSVGDEINYVKNYLKIQEIRYRDQFSTEIICPPEIERCRVLKLILQPLVENAIYHVDYSPEEPGRITVTASDDGDRIVFTVGNTPVSLTDEEEVKINEALRSGDDSMFGVGLKNVSRMIRLTYGPEYGIRFYNDLNRTCAQITVPKITDEV